MNKPEFEHEYYPADLQELALKAYEALPESGTVAQLVTRILAELPVHKSENGKHTFVGGNSYVQVGWRNDILTEPLGEETREVINVGTMQWFYEDDKSIMVCPDGKYISRATGSTSWETISEEQAGDYRDIRWEIVK